MLLKTVSDRCENTTVRLFNDNRIEIIYLIMDMIRFKHDYYLNNSLTKPTYRRNCCRVNQTRERILVNNTSPNRNVF